jgi:hypothetical protein
VHLASNEGLHNTAEERVVFFVQKEIHFMTREFGVPLLFINKLFVKLKVQKIFKIRNLPKNFKI